MDTVRGALALVVAALFCLLPAVLQAQDARFGDENIAAELRSDGPPRPGETWMLALQFTPKSKEWHGYWSNPGDAGQGMKLDLDLPQGWTAGEPLYPVPQTLVIAGLMNHIYEGQYAVLVPVEVPESAAVSNVVPITGFVSYLACTDRICVPQDARLEVREGGVFSRWQAAVAPQLDSTAGYEITQNTLRIGLSLPADLELGDLHLFVETTELGGGLTPDYAAIQTFIREGDLLVVEIPLKQVAGVESGARPESISGILSFGERQGVRFIAEPRDVPLEGAKPLSGPVEMPDLWVLVLASLAGGVLLNMMPCVFPILSLKALSLVKAGGDEVSGRCDALAYTAGIVLACAALGALVLGLRSAGEQVGWAFQLQEPRVVVGLLLLAAAITANFLSVFEVPGMALSGRKASPGGSFATGLLAAFVATPCTGPFMALALGAAIVLPPTEGMLIFAMLGIGLALPFLLVGFIPAFRRRLPKPGPWMERFRRWMALPMGLTALALVWLVWRVGGAQYLIIAGAFLGILLVLLYLAGRMQRDKADSSWRAVMAGTLVLTIVGLALLPEPSATARSESESLLDPLPFSERELAETRASGQPVFVWFTADWCVTCKVNESVAIEREETRDAFEKAGVVTMRGDWTRRDEEIAAFLSEQGAAGVPLYLWYPPGGEAQQLPQVLTPDFLVELAAE